MAKDLDMSPEVVELRRYLCQVHHDPAWRAAVRKAIESSIAVYPAHLKRERERHAQQIALEEFRRLMFP